MLQIRALWTKKHAFLGFGGYLKIPFLLTFQAVWRYGSTKTFNY